MLDLCVKNRKSRNKKLYSTSVMFSLLSRFHLLAEFDDGKRSCRKRLAGHNERRRKPQVGIHSGRAGRFLQPYGGKNVFTKHNLIRFSISMFRPSFLLLLCLFIVYFVFIWTRYMFVFSYMLARRE